MAGDYSTMGHTSPYLQKYNHYRVENFQEKKDTGAREPDSYRTFEDYTRASVLNLSYSRLGDFFNSPEDIYR
jgi:hypothetical protein